MHGSCLRVCLCTTCVPGACGDQKWTSDPETRVHMAVCHHINAGNLTQTLWEIKSHWSSILKWSMVEERRKEEMKPVVWLRAVSAAHQTWWPECHLWDSHGRENGLLQVVHYQHRFSRSKIIQIWTYLDKHFSLSWQNMCFFPSSEKLQLDYYHLKSKETISHW